MYSQVLTDKWNNIKEFKKKNNAKINQIKPQNRTLLSINISWDSFQWLISTRLWGFNVCLYVGFCLYECFSSFIETHTIVNLPPERLLFGQLSISALRRIQKETHCHYDCFSFSKADVCQNTKEGANRTWCSRRLKLGSVTYKYAWFPNLVKRVYEEEMFIKSAGRFRILCNSKWEELNVCDGLFYFLHGLRETFGAWEKGQTIKPCPVAPPVGWSGSSHLSGLQDGVLTIEQVSRLYDLQ